MFKHILFYGILILAGWICGLNISFAQCANQVTHISGTQTVNCVDVTVTRFGGADVLPGYCPSVTTPYLIGYTFANGNASGGYTFTFSPPITAATLNFSGISDFSPSGEEVMLFVNGVHYPIPAAGAPNACDAMAVLTPGGNIGGCTNCSVSGWSGTNLTGPITTLTVYDTIISGSPNGSLFSLYICSPTVSGGGVVDLGNDTSLCPGDNLLLDATTSGATYQWQDNSTNPTFTATGPGTYFVHVTTACGTYSDTIVVNFAANPVIDLGPDTTLCSGNVLVLNATQAGATYSWQDSSTNPTFTVNSPGTYYVGVTTACGSGSDTIVVTFNPNPVVNLGADQTLCAGDTLTLDATTPGANYEWQDHSTNATLDVVTNGTYWVEVNVNGCPDSDTIIISLVNSPTVHLGNDTAICLPGVFVLDATTGGSSYLWSDSTTDSTLTASSTGLYWVQVTNYCGVDVDSIRLTFNAPPVVSLGNDSTLCPGDSIYYDVTLQGATYQWQDHSNQPAFTVINPGTYWVNVGLNGCTDADTVNIQYYNLSIAHLGADTLVCEGKTIVLDATSTNSTYLWQDNSTSATYTVNISGEYSVTISTPCGMYTDSVRIDYQNCECYLYIPNAFTPNQDEVNPYFFPVTACNLKSYRLIIFDRWGRELFVTEDPSGKWDGNYNGTPYPIGVYAYRVEYQYNIPYSLPETRTGHVNLLR